MIDVIVVNWNSGRQIQRCIASLATNEGEMGKIFVVDNASSDDSIYLIVDPTNFTLIRSTDNLGFGRACNMGALDANSELLLFLNPDAAVCFDSLERSLAFMQEPASRDVGICGIQLLDEAGHVSRSCARFPSSLSFVALALGLDRVFPSWGHVMTEWPHDQTRNVDHVIGAYFLVRRNVFEELGGFDEQFFLYMEDLDFSFRARQAGWRSVYLADVQAFHAGGGTSNQIKARRLFYSLRSRLLYAFKHFSLAGAWLVLLTTLFIEPLSRSVFALLRGSLSALKETWRGYAMLWRWIPQWVFKGVTR